MGLCFHVSEGLDQGKELVLFCVILKGVESVEAPSVIETTSGSQEKYLILGADDLFNRKTLDMKKGRKA